MLVWMVCMYVVLRVAGVPLRVRAVGELILIAPPLFVVPIGFHSVTSSSLQLVTSRHARRNTFSQIDSSQQLQSSSPHSIDPLHQTYRRTEHHNRRIIIGLAYVVFNVPCAQLIIQLIINAKKNSATLPTYNNKQQQHTTT